MNNNGTLDAESLLANLLAEMGENPDHEAQAEAEWRIAQNEMIMAGYAV